MTAFGLSKTSSSKPVNEDTFISAPNIPLFAVFDGLGGHVGGRQAAETAREIFLEIFTKDRKDKEKLMISAFHLASETIANLRQDSILPPATTVSVVAFEKDKIVIGNLGDSRVYGVSKDGLLRRFTDDDSILSQKVKQGIISKRIAQKIDQAERIEDILTFELSLFQQRNMLTNCLSGRAIWQDYTAKIIKRFPVCDYSKIVLTTDGVHDNLTDKEISKLVTRSVSAKESARSLLDKAYKFSQQGLFRSKPDDITVVVVNLN